jgi:hypothetical protein
MRNSGRGGWRSKNDGNREPVIAFEKIQARPGVAADLDKQGDLCEAGGRF